MWKCIYWLTCCLVALSGACSADRPPKTKPVASAPRSYTSVEREDWVVTPSGIGPLRAGMTRPQAEAALGASLGIDGNDDWQECDYLPAGRLPSGVMVMVEAGTIARVEVGSSAIATSEGARIGDSEDRIRQLYRGRVITTPHKYTGGHSLTVRSAGADSLYGIVFETDRNRVTLYRSGRFPPVAYVENCE